MPVRVSGIFTFGDASSLGGTIMICAPLADVQRWYDMRGKLSSISMTAEPGVTPAELAARVRAALPATVEVKTGTQAAADSSSAVAGSINGILRPALLAFGGVAIFVGAFIIFNAFSITVAQRRREFAMMRAFGASRRQVLASVVGEALLMGVLASGAGLLAGLGVAQAVNWFFKAFGADFPAAGLVLEPRTIVVALAVGIGTALVAAILPSLRATTVPPVAALQEGAEMPASRFSRLTTPGAAVSRPPAPVWWPSASSAAVPPAPSSSRWAWARCCCFVAIAMVARHVVRPLARVIGWPLERLGGTAGRLARENATRNPARTANTAAALMIGLGLVVFVAVFAHGMKASFTGVFDKARRRGRRRHGHVRHPDVARRRGRGDARRARRADRSRGGLRPGEAGSPGPDVADRHRRGALERRVALRLARRRERCASHQAGRPRRRRRGAVREGATA